MDNSPNNPELAPLKDFRNFLYYLWHQLEQIQRDPTEIQYDIAKYMQNGGKRIGVEGFRGVGKSWICSGFVAHQLWLNPALNILVVSASKTRADDFSTFTLRLFQEIPILRHLQPRSDQRFSKVSFDVGTAPASHAPSVKSLGVTSQLTGSRADLIIADDIEVPTNSATQAMRDKLSEQIKEFDAILKPTETSKILFLGTPQCEDSIYTKLPERGYKFKVWPSEYISPATNERVYGGAVSDLCVADSQDPLKQEGSPTEPSRFDEYDLNERKLSYGRNGFALQFMLNPSLSDKDRYPLKLKDLIIATVDPEVGFEKYVHASEPDLEVKELPSLGMKGDRFYRPLKRLGDALPYTGSIMAIDPSGRGKDETGVCIMKMLNGFLHVPVLKGYKGGYEDATLQDLALLAKLFKVNRVIIEANFGDGMFSELLKPVFRKNGYPITIEEVKHSIQKEKRIIDTLEPVMNRHRLIIDPSVIQQDYDSIQEYPTEQRIYYSLAHQLTRITYDRGSLRQDDRLDVLAIATAYWVERMSVDEDEQISLRKEDLLDQELRKFMYQFRTGPTQHLCGEHKPLVGFVG